MKFAAAVMAVCLAPLAACSSGDELSGSGRSDAKAACEAYQEGFDGTGQDSIDAYDKATVVSLRAAQSDQGFQQLSGEIAKAVKLNRNFLVLDGPALGDLVALAQESADANTAVGRSCAAAGVEIVNDKGKPVR